MSFILKDLAVSNIPIGDIKTSDPYIKIYQLGSCKFYVHRTKTIDSVLSTKWEEKFPLFTIRGTKLKLEVYDADKAGTDSLLAHLYIDTTVIPSDQVHTFPLIKDGGKKGESATISFSFTKITPIKFPLTPNNPQESIKTSIYLTVQLAKPIPINTKNDLVSQLFRYELSVIGIRGDNSIELCSSSNPNLYSIDHSENNHVFTGETSSQCIRIDPQLMAANKFTKAYVILNAPSKVPLKNINTNFTLNVWISKETKTKFESDICRLKDLKDGETDFLSVKSIPIEIKPESTFNIVSFFEIKDANKGIGSMTGVTYSLPNSTNSCSNSVGFTIPNITQVLKLTSPKKIFDFPLFNPVPVSSVLKFVGANSVQSFSIKIKPYKTQNLGCVAFNSELKATGSCHSKSPKLFGQEISFSQGTISVISTFSPSYLLFFVINDPPSKSLVNLIDLKETATISLWLNDKDETLSIKNSLNRDENSLILFLLYRDYFGEVCILNLSLPVAVKSSEKFESLFPSLAKSILNCC